MIPLRTKVRSLLADLVTFLPFFLRTTGGLLGLLLWKVSCFFGHHLTIHIHKVAELSCKLGRASFFSLQGIRSEVASTRRTSVQFIRSFQHSSTVKERFSTRGN